MVCIPYVTMSLNLLWVVTALLMISTFGYQLARQVAWCTVSEYWEVAWQKGVHCRQGSRISCVCCVCVLCVFVCVCVCVMQSRKRSRRRSGNESTEVQCKRLISVVI